MRNAIMHIRNLSNRLVQNYEKATNNQSSTAIMKLIKNFWIQENEALKKQTWLALAKSQVNKVVTLESNQDNEPVFRTDGTHYMYELEEVYVGVDALKLDLIPYLMDYVVVEGFDPSDPEFEAELNTMIDTILVKT